MNALIENAANVIFDVGRVLLTFEPDLYLPRLIAGPLGQRVTRQMIYDTDLWAKLDNGDITAEDMARYTARQAGEEAQWRQILPAVVDFCQLMEPMPPVELIPKLKAMGKQVYVLSNYGWESFDRTAAHFPAIFSQMDGMVISSHERISKPDPRIYRLLMSRYGLNPAACVFIDDRPENIEGARSVGMQGIVYTGMDALI